MLRAVSNDDVTIEEARVVNEELVDAFALLIPQLSSSSPPPGAEELQQLVDSRDSILLIARDPQQDNRIVGTMCLAFYLIPTGMKAWIEDVVVDGDARGRGVGDKLNRHALELAQARGAKGVDLTSRPSREAANRLYQRIGFDLRETNVYRYKF
jgi:ribosomal protein S18 acetylase RimI-like enzyme